MGEKSGPGDELNLIRLLASRGKVSDACIIPAARLN